MTLNNGQHSLSSLGHNECIRMNAFPRLICLFKMLSTEIQISNFENLDKMIMKSFGKKAP